MKLLPLLHVLRFPLMSAGVLSVVMCASSQRHQSPPEALKAPQVSRVKVVQNFIPESKFGREGTTMRPTYITIHSMQNPDAGAAQHAKALSSGELKSKYNRTGYLTWHFTVDDSSVYQHLPCDETGQQADYEGLGNRASIGIEMCENRGNSRERTIDRTAMLTGQLMKDYDIPISHVVPHHHWRQIRYKDGRDLGHKNCPHFLLENGRPGRKWEEFKELVNSYYKKL